MQISLLFKALKTGEQLADPTTWKVRQNAINVCTAALGLVFAFMPHLQSTLGITNDDLLMIAGGIATIGGVVNNYLTTATTKKIGVGVAPEPEEQPAKQPAELKADSLSGQ